MRRHKVAYMLDFCPVGKEHYLLLILENVLETPQDLAMLQALDKVSIDNTLNARVPFSLFS